MKALILASAAVSLSALTACSTNMESESATSKAPAARVVGDPRACIPINQINESTVHDNQTIDFRVGGQTYRNTLPLSCPSLGFEKSFTYKTSLSQLCNTDVIFVLRNTAGSLERGAGCGLGMFVPVELEKNR